MDVTLQDVLDTALIVSGTYTLGTPVLMIVTAITQLLVYLSFKWMGFSNTIFSMRYIFFVWMVIYAAPCIALAVLGVYAPVHLRIALIIFAILQVPIAFYHFGFEPDDMRQQFGAVLFLKAISQFLAVFTAHFMGVWLEGLFFA